MQSLYDNFKRLRSFHNVFEINDRRECTTSATLLYILSIHRYSALARVVLEKGVNVNEQGEYHGNALQAASLTKANEIVKMLIEKEANINA